MGVMNAGSVSFTTSLGFGRKLDRIKANPRVALAYHAREHGFAREHNFVLVQGTASYDATPDRDVLEDVIQPAAKIATLSAKYASNQSELADQKVAIPTAPDADDPARSPA